jgi:hypothetical protein
VSFSHGQTPPLGVVCFVTRPLATQLSMVFRFKLIRRRLDDQPTDFPEPSLKSASRSAAEKENTRDSSGGHPERRPMGYTAGDNRAHQRRCETEERRVLGNIVKLILGIPIN